jgi:hypothetical protein
VGKIIFVMAGIFLATFAMGRVESFAAHRGFGGSLAWAQSWGDLSGDASPQTGDSQAQTAPPNIAGPWVGTIDDHHFGEGDLSFEFTQNGSKLKGTYDSSFGGGKLKGKIKSDGSISAALKIEGSCVLAAHGTLEAGEITGVYHAAGCARSDHGTFEVAPE